MAAPLRSVFQPRQVFRASESLPRSYFLGHHLAGLRAITRRLGSTDLFIECRDYRLPLSSVSPLLDRVIAAKPRIIVYTHSDLVNGDYTSRLRELSPGATVVASSGTAKDAQNVIEKIRRLASEQDSLTGMTAMVVGMPNTGKSTLLNRLRRTGMKNPKSVAQTGDTPGVTRSLSTPIRILGNPKVPESSVYVVDAPGVFYPYVSEPVDMVKLSLTRSVKVGLIPDDILADYLLYRVNLVDPSLYARYSEPTNEVNELLEAVARRIGRIGPGGKLLVDAAATAFVDQWRKGNLGKFMLDDVSDEAFEKKKREWIEPPVSGNQLRKQRKEKILAKREGHAGGTSATTGRDS